MTNSPTTQLPAGVVIEAQRHGERVTGRVQLPDNRRIPIDYTSQRPDTSRDRRTSRDREGAATTDDRPSKADTRAASRRSVVERYQQLCRSEPAARKRDLAERAAEVYDGKRPSWRTVQSWVRNYELKGEDGLRDHYVAAPRRTLQLEAKVAFDAVRICAWWAFRIGGVERIDRKMVHTAAAIAKAGHQVADLFAVIDCYYSYPCNRQQYPFKPFSRWAKYDLGKWILRACEDGDYRRALDAARDTSRASTSRAREEAGTDQNRDSDGAAPSFDTLQAPTQSLHAKATTLTTAPDPKTRRRQTGNYRTRREIQNLEPSAVSSQPSSKGATGGLPASARPAEAVAAASTLRAAGCSQAARAVVASTAPGIPPLAGNDDPRTIAEALGKLDPSWRAMLIAASQGDRAARDQAATMLPLWWEQMPQAVRNNIDFLVGQWCDSHGHRLDDPAPVRRRLDMLLNALRKPSAGFQTLRPAARIPV